MKLFVLRHGEAAQFAKRDDQRELTPLGLTQTRDVLLRSASDLQLVTRVFASPYVRAQQTAQLVAAQLGLPINTADILTPDNGLTPLAVWLNQHIEETPLLVGHQPLVGNLVDWLTGTPRGQYFMGTSTLACLEYDVPASGCAEMCWLRQPGDVHE